jgi:hypothetical protein
MAMMQFDAVRMMIDEFGFLFFIDRLSPPQTCST